MKPTKSEKLISATKAGEMLGLDATTVLAGKSDTGELTRVPVGTRGVRFIESEVQSLVLRWIAKAREKQKEKTAEKPRTALRLVPAPDQVLKTIRKFQR